MATAAKKTRPATKPRKFLNVENVRLVEGINRKQLATLQEHAGLRLYSFDGAVFVEEGELHAAVDRLAKVVPA